MSPLRVTCPSGLILSVIWNDAIILGVFSIAGLLAIQLTTSLLHTGQ